MSERGGPLGPPPVTRLFRDPGAGAFGGDFAAAGLTL